MRNKCPDLLGTLGQKGFSPLVTKLISTPSPKSLSLWGVPFFIPQPQWETLSSPAPSLVRLPNSTSELGTYTLLDRQPKSTLCGYFLHFASKTRDICLALLIYGYLPVWISMQPQAKQGHPISSCHTCSDTLAQGAYGSLLCCHRAALGAKRVGVLQIWTPNTVGACKFLRD